VTDALKSLRMRFRVILLTFVFLLLHAAGDEAARVDRLFAQWNKPGSPGAAVAVVRNGEIVFKYGYGLANLEYDIPITPATVFHVASVSKQFTAMSILLLEQQGKLSIDDDIHKYLPEMADFGATITLRNLLNHTSGLRDQWDLVRMAGWRMDDVITQRQLLSMLFHQKELNFAPGAEHLYCNSGFTLLAEIVHRVSGRTFPQFTRDAIFQPLAMNSTHFHDDHEMLVKNRAYSYQPDGERFKLAALNYANVGATSLFTTVEDLAKWAHNFELPRVGDAALIARMETPGVLNNGKKLDYACGIVVSEFRGLRVVQHSGGDAGYRSQITMFPDQKFSVVVLSNLATAVPGRLAMQVAGIYLADRFPKPEDKRPDGPVAPGRKFEKLSPERLQEFAGDYYSEELGTNYTLVMRNDRLVATHRRHDDVLLAHVSGDDFRGEQSYFRAIHFTRASNGRVAGLLLSSGRVRNVRFVRN
jgi:CubicO group peptidase (beta-lactamase class C family)